MHYGFRFEALDEVKTHTKSATHYPVDEKPGDLSTSPDLPIDNDDTEGKYYASPAVWRLRASQVILPIEYLCI